MNKLVPCAVTRRKLEMVSKKKLQRKCYREQLMRNIVLCGLLQRVFCFDSKLAFIQNFEVWRYMARMFYM